MDTSALSLESHPYPITSSHDSQVYNGGHGLQGQSFFPPSSMSHVGVTFFFSQIAVKLS